MNTNLGDKIKRTFFYQHGKVFYKMDRGKKKFGERAGSKAESSAYRILTVDGKKLLEHRVIYFLCHGDWPDLVDHINKDKLDNRIENLRPATKSQNALNAKLKPKGARLHSCGKWESFYTEGGKFKSLGYFNCKTAAMVASSLARQKFGQGFYNPFT